MMALQKFGFCVERAQLKHVCQLKSERDTTCFQSLSRQCHIPHPTCTKMAKQTESDKRRSLIGFKINLYPV